MIRDVVGSVVVVAVAVVCVGVSAVIVIVIIIVVSANRLGIGDGCMFVAMDIAIIHCVREKGDFQNLARGSPLTSYGVVFLGDILHLNVRIRVVGRT